jgi:hypothetical protein
MQKKRGMPFHRPSLPINTKAEKRQKKIREKIRRGEPEKKRKKEREKEREGKGRGRGEDDHLQPSSATIAPPLHRHQQQQLVE